MSTSSCFCGCSLKTGTIFIGVFYLTVDLLAIVLPGVALAYWISETEDEDEDEDTSNCLKGITAANIAKVLDEGDIAKVILGIYITIFVLLILVNIMLLVGAMKEKRALLYVWFVLHIVMLVLGAIGVMGSVFEDCDMSAPERDAIALSVIYIFLLIYCVVVVHSYYKELEEEEKEHELPGMWPKAAALNMEYYPMPPPNEHPS